MPSGAMFKMVYRGKCSDGEIHYIGGSEILPPPLNADKEKEVLKYFACFFQSKSA